MRVLLLYPNLYGMNMLPPAIGLFTSLLKREGHDIALFDTTVYEHIEGFNIVDFDKMKSENLNARLFDDSILQDGKKKTSCSEDLKKLLNEFSPDLIAMSCTEDMYPLGIAILKNIGKVRPKVVLGGIFPTSAPQLAIDMSGGTIDYVLTGEGENSLLDFCRKMEKGEEPSGVEGIYYYQKGRIVKRPLPSLVNVNSLPLPDYSLFQESRYYRPMQGKLWRMFPIETHRGCPYTCAYCNSPTTADIYKRENKRFFRKKNIENICAELRHCVDTYNADSFYFWADTFLAWTDKEFDAFCEMYEEFRLPFWVQTRPETITEYRMRKLKDVGLLRIAFGLEHGNEKFRQEMLNRRVKNSTIIEKLDIVHEYGIPFSVNNIIGFPKETRELSFDTIELNRSIKSDGINAYTFTPFHGTPLRKVAEEAGLLNSDELSRCIGAPSVLKMEQFKPEEIEGIRRCFVLYVKMPKKKWSDIAKAEKLTPEGDAIWAELREECLNDYIHYQEPLD